MPQESEAESERINVGVVGSHLYRIERFDEKLVCPEPRRLTSMMTSSPTEVHQSPWSWRREACDGNEAGHEILDIFLAKSTLGGTSGFGCSPPYFSGSPPSRAQNPMVRDVEFSRLRRSGSPMLASFSSQDRAPSSRGSTTRHAMSPLIRIEGFDCLVRGFDCALQDSCHRVTAFA